MLRCTYSTKIGKEKELHVGIFDNFVMLILFS